MTARWSRTTVSRALAPAGVLITLGAAAAGAQTPPETAAMAAACPEGIVSEVIIDNSSVFDLSDPGLGGRFSWAYRLANALHIRTKSEVIDRELLFSPGDCYDLEQLRDSERLLRGFGFIARADIYGVRQSDEAVQVVVDTQDEWSTRVEPKVGSGQGGALQGLRLVEDNLLGSGRHLSLFLDRAEHEQVYGVGFFDPQLLSTRTDLSLQAARTEVGYSYHQSVAYPFVGETGRLAFRQQIARSDRYFELLMRGPTDETERMWIPVRREQIELGGAFRWGGDRYRHAIFGAALVGERIRFPGAPIFPDSLNRPEVPAEALPMGWRTASVGRAMFLLGGRSVSFVQRRAMETINGIEDLQLGVEGEIAVGPTLPYLSDDSDLGLGGGLSVATEPAEGIVIGGQVAVEGRRTFRGDDEPAGWHDVTGELDGWVYLRTRPGSPHSIVASLSAVGGWKASAPFQLTLGGDTGLRGYPRHLDPGGRRLVASIEHRRYLGWPFPDLLDLGGIVFVDAGKIWPGDAPFGTESPFRATAGLGIRAAFPPGSRQTFRADFGVPLRSGVGIRNFVVSIGVGQVIGRQVAERDPQLLRSARYTLTSSRFLNSTRW